jgi:maleate isomerase
MSLQSATRTGLVVPSGNAAAEPEIGTLVHPGINVYTSRFPNLPDLELRERLETYNNVLSSVLDGFGRLALNAAIVACSGSHYLLGPEQDRKFCDAVGQAAGYPVASSTVATLDACTDMGVTELVLVSPYASWLTELSREYWEAAGLKVRAVVPVRADGRFSPYDVTADELVRQVRDADLGPDAALLFTGTGMFTFEALQEIGDGNNRILLTSNICSALWIRRQAGLPGADSGAAWPLRRLAGQAGTSWT